MLRQQNGKETVSSRKISKPNAEQAKKCIEPSWSENASRSYKRSVYLEEILPTRVGRFPRPASSSILERDQIIEAPAFLKQLGVREKAILNSQLHSHLALNIVDNYHKQHSFLCTLIIALRKVTISAVILMRRPLQP